MLASLRTVNATFTAAGTQTVAHNMGYTPTVVTAHAEDTAGAAAGFNIASIDATNVVIRAAGAQRVVVRLA
jgi:hypothetical protein